MFPVWEGLLEKMFISGIINAYIKHHSGMSYSDTGHDFKVNKGTKYIKLGVLQQNLTENKVCIDQLMQVLWLEAHRNLNLYFPKEKWFSTH